MRANGVRYGLRDFVHFRAEPERAGFVVDIFRATWEADVRHFLALRVYTLVQREVTPTCWTYRAEDRHMLACTSAVLRKASAWTQSNPAKVLLPLFADAVS